MTRGSLVAARPPAQGRASSFTLPSGAPHHDYPVFHFTEWDTSCYPRAEKVSCSSINRRTRIQFLNSVLLLFKTVQKLMLWGITNLENLFQFIPACEVKTTQNVPLLFLWFYAMANILQPQQPERQRLSNELQVIKPQPQNGTTTHQHSTKETHLWKTVVKRSSRTCLNIQIKTIKQAQVPRPATSASPGNLSEMQITRPYSRPPGSEALWALRSCSDKSSGWPRAAEVGEPPHMWSYQQSIHQGPLLGVTFIFKKPRVKR